MRRRATIGLLLLSGLLVLKVVPASALLKMDFEQPYYVHPGHQVWDFCVVRPQATYHIFYHAIREDRPGAANGDTIWHATSPDLVHWMRQGPVLAVGPNWWDAGAIWAPDVIWDSAQQRWVMVYTGVDSLMVQRTCLATSLNLNSWTKSPFNPLADPDSLTYYWSPTLAWSSWRDPYLYFAQGQWNMLSTAALRLEGYPGYRKGIVHRATSNDLVHWIDQGPFFRNDGAVIWHDLESSQYVVRQGWHHLFFGESYVDGISHVVAASPEAWRMADRQVIDGGGAPEIDEFDPGVDILSRWAMWDYPLTGKTALVVRFDTLSFNPPDAAPTVIMPHPLERDWIELSGTAAEANPTFGDNPALRGEESCGLVGNGWFGSKENYRGPLTGSGAPGAQLGDQATCVLTSRPFVITGSVIRLLVGGGYYPFSCYVALIEAQSGAILRKETGNGSERMTPRFWDVSSLHGLTAAIRIVDVQTGAFGHINVDEIEEFDHPDDVADLPSPGLLIEHGVAPNPGNPSFLLHYTLAAGCLVRVSICDLQGRCVWRTEPTRQERGAQTLVWRGRDQHGRDCASGLFVYQIELNGRFAASGKLTLLR